MAKTSKSITVTCPCGNEMMIALSRHRSGRGKYCSRKCMYMYRVRPRNLTYEIKTTNSGWFKPGHNPNKTSFKPGHKTWNKGIKGTHFSPETEFTSEQVSGPNNPRWHGGIGNRYQDQPGYRNLHVDLVKQRGKASLYICEFADETCKGILTWANISQQYIDVHDFMPLCQSHHLRYDGGSL